MIATVPVTEIAHSKANSWVQVLDVREPSEFEAGHIEGATFIPLAIVPLRVDELRKAERIVLVCESGARAMQASQYLARQGFDVQLMDGGMAAWRQAGLPVVTGR